MTEPISHRPGRDQDPGLHQLAAHLREAVAETEKAVLDITARFLAIADRARQQLATSKDLRQDSARTTAGDLDTRLNAVSAETEALSKDIQDIVIALQFQDMTRQKIELVIDRLGQLHHELEQARSQVCGMANHVPFPKEDHLRTISGRDSIAAERCHGKAMSDRR